MRIRPITSSFYIPEGRPICMVANGSGIAPFRSITQYVASLPREKRPYLRLYICIYAVIMEFRAIKLIITLMSNGSSMKKKRSFKSDWLRVEKIQTINNTFRTYLRRILTGFKNIYLKTREFCFYVEDKLCLKM